MQLIKHGLKIVISIFLLSDWIQKTQVDQLKHSIHCQYCNQLAIHLKTTLSSLTKCFARINMFIKNILITTGT